LAVAGSSGCTRASAALTRCSVWNMSTFHEKNKSISFVPRVVIDCTRSRPWTVFSASSIGLVTVTCI